MHGRAKLGSERDGHKLVAVVLSLVLGGFVAFSSSSDAVAAPVIAPGHVGKLTITDVGATLGFSTSSDSRIASMKFGPGPDPAKTYLYAVSFFGPATVRRMEYNVASATLVAGTLTTVPNAATHNGIGIGIGIGFHGSDMYLSENASATGGATSRLWRLIDDNGDGTYAAGETKVAIVEGIPRDDHNVNQISIVGDTLFVTSGVRTQNGAFQSPDGQGYGESAYGGAVLMIDDLTQVPSTANAAGFFPANPNAAQYEGLIKGTDPAGKLPYTSTAANKLRVHSSGTRNNYGNAIDGDGNLWFTNNFQRVSNDVYDRDNINSAENDGFDGDGLFNDIHDQLFKAVEFGDYGYRNGNWQGDGDALAAGFFLAANRIDSFTYDNSDSASSVLHDPANPDGLGPSSSSNGVDFYDGNALPVEYHKDAFIARWQSAISDGGESMTFSDVVAVDTDTAAVTRIASGFENPLEVIADPNGNLIVSDWNGSVFVIKAASPHSGTHAFTWDSDANGNWSDRLTWNGDTEAAGDRLVPHAWGTARYAVTIDRAGGNPAVVLDQDATIESMTLSETLDVLSNRTLTVQQQLEVQAGGTLTGTGTVAGAVMVHANGAVAPGASLGTLTVEDYSQDAGTLAIEIGGLLKGSDYDVLNATGAISLTGGELEVSLINDFAPQSGNTFDILDFASLTGEFNVLNLPDLGMGLDWGTSNLYISGQLTVIPEPATLCLLALSALTALCRRRGATICRSR